MSPARFPLVVRLLHWTMAPLLIAMLLIGTGMITTVSHWHNTLLDLHKPLGLALLVLAVLRLLLRLAGKAPKLPATLPLPVRLAAHGSHWTLYGCMLAMPLIGWAMLSAGGSPLPLIAGTPLPPLIAPSLAHYVFLRSLHKLVGEAFFVLILGHILAGLTHALLLRDGVFETITLRSKRNASGINSDSHSSR